MKSSQKLCSWALALTLTTGDLWDRLFTRKVFVSCVSAPLPPPPQYLTPARGISTTARSLLLTLNETIEDLKYQRQYYSRATSCASLTPSGHFLSPAGQHGGSAWSVSDTEMYESDEDFGSVAMPGATTVAATSTPVGATATTTAASSSGTVTPMSASSASLVKVKHQSQGHGTGQTWYSARNARKSSAGEFDPASLGCRGTRLGSAGDGDGEPGLAAEVQAALRKMDVTAGRTGDSAIFPSAFVDTYRAVRPEQRNPQKDASRHSKREVPTYKITLAPSAGSPVVKTLKFTTSGDHCLDLTPGPTIRHDRDQHSFDSGIHEPTLSEEIVWNV
ncbi:hypothetical protein ElyMa_005896300 [Elysia marginata]|uniref:Uncharacterized protein n=1 Tax=Elysia marginata TaxID=1093978 RepID=A0AAV4G5U7_9GAST|nr:hypothetical protein ElyMa_005896300 [Elysia marginata]